LFGHERGAFPGATERVEGAFERAHGGTLLLDEISEMRLDLQARLLHVLQEQEFARVGGSTSVRVDVRIVATSNRDLADEATNGRFRQDLFYRVSTVTVRVPPLRGRAEDIPLLATRFAQRAGGEIGKEITGFAPEAMKLLERHDWPGNVRELQNVVERAVILSPDPILRAALFEPERGAAARRRPEGSSAGSTPAATVPEGAVVLTSLDVGEAEQALIDRALVVTHGNRTRAAKLLGISVRTLRNKLNPRPATADQDEGDEETAVPRVS